MYGHYSDCIEICSKHYKEFPSTHVLGLLLAKSVFHVYRRQAFQLQEMQDTQKVKSGKKYNLLHQECYSNARKVIDILSDFLDSGDVDDEGSKMLDIAMIDYSRETNRLNECSR